MLQSQRELELDMVSIGREKVERTHSEAEEKGRASNNPYASTVHRRFVEPLAHLLETKYTAPPRGRGPLSQAKALMRGIDPLVAAYLGIRTALNILVPEPGTKANTLASRLGTSVYGEVLLSTFRDINPGLFHVLTRDLKRRMSKDERHRVNVFRHEAKAHGLELPEWSTADRALVGHAILREMEGLDLVKRQTVSGRGITTVNLYDLHPDVRDMLDQIKEFVSLTQPAHMPCVERPRPWVTANDGGWHTQEMRRANPTCLTSESFVNEDDVPAFVLDSLNHLQDVEWQINTRLLTAAQNVSRHFDVGDVLNQSELPRPPRPEWLREDMQKESMDEEQLREFNEWKREVAGWHTEQKARATKWGRFYESMRVANRFKDYPCLYFVYQADYRGRFYAKSRGVSPQGSDLQKALLRFRKGGLISSSPESIEWFKINGANRFGYDKAELPDRVRWVDEHEAMILRNAADPIRHRDWTEADKPFQFLAWCFEYADWKAFPNEARTYLAVGLDGTCSGLQHFSALTRDEVGGAATNLVPGKRRDIYETVALRLTERLRDDESDDPIKDVWIQHGITRKLTKRSCMTLAYGATRYSCADFIQTDYLRMGYAPEIAKDDYGHAANWLSYRLWDAIGEVVVRGQEAMAWLQGAARDVVAMGHDEVSWVTPNGFRVRQRYSASRKLRIVSNLHGRVQVNISLREFDDGRVDGRKHITSIAPNFVHSLDAAHLQRVVMACKARGIDALAMIHDDYGTTADRTQELYSIIRETFVRMYGEHDPLADLAEQYGLGDVPAKGELEILGVLNSTHFFS